MSLDLGEQIADEIVAYLSAQMPDQLAEITTTPVLELPAPRRYSIADPIDAPDVLEDTPLCFVVVPRVALPTWGKSGGEFSYAQQTIDVVIWLVVMDVDVEVLFRRRARYLRAIFELLIKGTAAGSIAAHLDAAGEGTGPRAVIDYGETLTRGEDFLADARLFVTMTRKDLA